MKDLCHPNVSIELFFYQNTEVTECFLRYRRTFVLINQNFIQFFLTSLPKQLNWSDINSMSHSIETRSPFLDFNFV